nr:GntR family transcriptional regulator [Ktedonobacteraceae bacterium]
MELNQSGQEMEVSTVQHDMVQHIVEEVKAQIREGKSSTGTHLPSEYALSEQFRVSRTDAHQILQMLKREYLAQGDELRKFGSFIKERQARGLNPDAISLEDPSVIAAPAEVAEHLELSTDQLVLKRYRLQIADNLPYRLIESYYPADLFGELLTAAIGQQPLFEWLKEHHGLKAAKVQEKLEARMANDYERKLLAISPNVPVVDLERTVWADNGRRIEWAKITAVAELYTFTSKYAIEWPQQ